MEVTKENLLALSQKLLDVEKSLLEIYWRIDKIKEEIHNGVKTEEFYNKVTKLKHPNTDYDVGEIEDVQNKIG